MDDERRSEDMNQCGSGGPGGPDGVQADDDTLNNAEGNFNNLVNQKQQRTLKLKLSMVSTKAVYMERNVC